MLPLLDVLTVPVGRFHVRNSTERHLCVVPAFKTTTCLRYIETMDLQIKPSTNMLYFCLKKCIDKGILIQSLKTQFKTTCYCI